MGFKGEAPAFGWGFLFTVSIIAGWVELIRQFPGQKKSFILFRLWGFPRFWGLDGFGVGLAGKNRQLQEQGQYLVVSASPSLLPSAERLPLRGLVLMARLKPCP
jgi:hypothetical protein